MKLVFMQICFYMNYDKTIPLCFEDIALYSKLMDYYKYTRVICDLCFDFLQGFIYMVRVSCFYNHGYNKYTNIQMGNQR